MEILKKWFQKRKKDKPITKYFFLNVGGNGGNVATNNNPTRSEGVCKENN
jgi:hypothetical protein